MDPETIDTAINTTTVGVCFFCAHLLLLRRRDPGVYLPLALLFLFQGIATTFVTLSFGVGETDFSSPLTKVGILIGVLEIASPFLFWLYVHALTTEGEMERIPGLRYHIIPIVVATACFWSLLLLPIGPVGPEIKDSAPQSIGIVIISIAFLIGDVLVKAMILAYLYLTSRRLIQYQERLKQVFASTENRELNWIWLIVVGAGVFFLLSVTFSIAVGMGVINEDNLNDEAIIAESLAQFALFWIIGIWGLRQRPGLMRGPVIEPKPPEEASVRKYEKSALDSERAVRIARKIEAAMEKDMLYRDANLSLWDLAKHISVTSHYVSQTLNTQLHKSFFDLVNGWRIKDAIEQLKTTDETILVIAYDVGFNSRSAFYKAFKRETGKTPSDLRK